MADWSPSQYLRFADERTRAGAELLARVGLTAPKRVTDVGCGPGNSTELLAARWPSAAITGFDSSPAMIAAAEARLPGVRFFIADAGSWLPDGDDVVFANAVFHWVPDHVARLARILAAMKRGAVLAVQMPDNFAAPVHEAMREAASAGPWAGAFDGLFTRESVAPVGVYYDALAPHAARIDLWQSVYHHLVADVRAIVEWMEGTGLRPYLERLDGSDRAAFLAAYEARLAAAYPQRADGRVIFAAPRLFIVAERR